MIRQKKNQTGKQFGLENEQKPTQNRTGKPTNLAECKKD